MCHDIILCGVSSFDRLTVEQGGAGMSDSSDPNTCETTQDLQKTDDQNGYRLIAQLLGYSAYVAWALILFATPIFCPYDLYTLSDTTFCRVAFLLGLLACLFITWKFFKPTQKNTVLLLAFFACPITLLLVVANHLVVPFYLRVFLWFVCGCFVVFVLLIWSLVFAQLDYNKAPLFISIAIVISALFALVVSFVQFASETIGILLPLVSVVTCKESKSVSDFKIIFPKDLKITARYLRISHKLDGGIMAYSVCLGFACFCISIPEFWPVNIIGFFTAVCLSSILWALDARKEDRRISLTFLHKIFLFLVLFFALPLLLLNKWVFLACSIVGVFFFVFNTVLNLSGLAIGSIVYEFPPIPYSCRAKMPNIAALAIGYFVAYLYINALETGVEPFIINAFIVVFILILAAISTFSLTNSFPSETDPLEEDQRRTLAMNTKERHGWSERCNRFSDLYGFSARQHDVLKYLSRGRNAPYIAETLFISESTVKSHIYSIYKKSGVHSAQELIDRIENFDKDLDT
jgi:DNA-binding CsgD family transcriptional regulator